MDVLGQVSSSVSSWISSVSSWIKEMLDLAFSAFRKKTHTAARQVRQRAVSHVWWEGCNCWRQHMHPQSINLTTCLTLSHVWQIEYHGGKAKKFPVPDDKVPTPHPRLAGKTNPRSRRIRSAGKINP